MWNTFKTTSGQGREFMSQKSDWQLTYVMICKMALDMEGFWDSFNTKDWQLVRLGLLYKDGL